MEEPWPLNLAQNDTQREIKLYKTLTDGAKNGEGEVDAQGNREIITRHKPLKTGRELGRRSRPAGGGSDIRATETGKGRKGQPDRRTPGADRDLGVG